MYAQAAVKRNIIPRNGAYRIVNRDVHFCTPPCSSLRSKNYTSLGRITLDTATEETKGSGNMLVARKVFYKTEEETPLTNDVLILVENICGQLLLIGCEDDCLWPTDRYIRHIDQRLKNQEHSCKYDALIYEYGTHYAFPESMLKQIIPVFSNFLIGRVFLSARQHPKECRVTREDTDRRMKNAIKEWKDA